MKIENKKARSWCWTWNNPTTEPVLPTGARYLVFGREIGESGTPHLQGFITWENQVRLSTCRSFLSQAHWEIARGHPVQAADYCKKDGDFLEYGTPPMTSEQAGNREAERWKSAKLAAQENRLDDIPDDIYIRYYRTVKEIAKDHITMPNPLDQLCNEWWHGESGTGKSRKAFDEHPGAYRKMCNKWWDGYQGEEIVIIDDLDIKHDVLAHHLKIWGDHYPFLAETKGGAIAIRPKKIIVTSNYPIHVVFPLEESRSPVERRFRQTKFSKLKEKQ